MSRREFVKSRKTKTGQTFWRYRSCPENLHSKIFGKWNLNSAKQIRTYFFKIIISKFSEQFSEIISSDIFHFLINFWLLMFWADVKFVLKIYQLYFYSRWKIKISFRDQINSRNWFCVWKIKIWRIVCKMLKGNCVGSGPHFSVVTTSMSVWIILKQVTISSNLEFYRFSTFIENGLWCIPWEQLNCKPHFNQKCWKILGNFSVLS